MFILTLYYDIKNKLLKPNFISMKYTNISFSIDK